MAHKGMRFGIFLAPFHRLGENPTLAMGRDMELIEWMDFLGYDEVWVGEHHSAGWEIIASPEIFIAAVAERTKHIRLGSGVTSLPYHHPFLVAQRFVQLDHMTRGRTMLGCGPGALVSDAYMMGIEPVQTRPRMDEALDAIMELLKCEEPVTLKTDWFELREARLHLKPYTDPHFEIAVASVMTPSGVVAAGRHGLGVLSLGAGLPGGPDALAQQWKIAEDTAAKHGKTMDRSQWKLVVNVHVAEDDEEALRQVKKGERHETITYFEETLSRPPGRSDDPLTDGVKMGTTLVGSPDLVIRGIKKLWDLSGGGFGPWEFVFTAVVTFCAYQGLRSYRFIGVTWLLHTGWDMLHHLYGNPIIPFVATSSFGCAICDPVIAMWCFAGGPSVLKLKPRSST